MNLGEMIAQIDKIRPSHYDKDDLTGWISEVDQRVVDEVLNKAVGFYLVFDPYLYDQDSERTLLIPNQFKEVYETYVYAKIDFSNAEIDRYNMDAAMAASAWNTFAAWFRRTHLPKPDPHWKFRGPHEIHRTSSSYLDLTDKPSIEGVTLEGNKTFPELKLRDLTNDEIAALFE